MLENAIQSFLGLRYESDRKAGSTENGPRHLAFNAWEKTPEMPIEFIEIGSSSVCVFNSGGKKIAVSSDHCDERALIDMGVHVSIMGADTRILQ